MEMTATTGLSPMQMTFDQFNKVEQPIKTVHTATKDELENPTKAPTDAIRTKPASVLGQVRQMYNTQLNDKQSQA